MYYIYYNIQNIIIFINTMRTVSIINNPFKRESEKIGTRALEIHKIHIYKEYIDTQTDNTKYYINFIKNTKDSKIQLDSTKLLDVNKFYQTYWFNTGDNYPPIKKVFLIIIAAFPI